MVSGKLIWVRNALPIFVLALVIAGLSDGQAAEKSSSETAFARLKTLEGTWEYSVDGSPKKSTARYVLTGAGNVLMEIMGGGMSTAYHMDKGTLMLTHYCGAGNQPRMRVKKVENGGRRIVFEMYDITNLKSPDAYRTTSLDVRFHDDGTVDLVYGGWTKEDGSSSQTFKLLRRTSTKSLP